MPTESPTAVEIPARRPRRSPPHPGEFLREFLFPDLGPDRGGMSVAAVAEAIGVSRQHLHDICGGRKPMSVEITVKLAKLAGVEPAHLYRWQVTFDIWHAEENLAGELRKIKTRPRVEE